MFEEEQNDVPPQLNGGRRTKKSKKSHCAKSMKSQNGGKKSQNGGKKSQNGGKKSQKTRKSKGPSDWNKKVMMIYREMKKKDKNVKLGSAMKEASRRKKAGKL